METIIEIEKTKKVYDGKTVLDIDSFKFKKGVVYALVGPNGSGKSTLLSIISLIIPPTSGRISFNGTDVASIDAYTLRRQVTMVHQEPVMFRTTVKKNVSMGLIYRGVPKRDVAMAVRKALTVVGMEDFEGRGARTLSGGETRRVAIARGMAFSPEVLLLDEPTAGVDNINAEKIEGLITRINRELKTTIIFTTHNLKQAYRLSDEVMTLMNGRLETTTLNNLFSGRPERVNSEPVFNTGKIVIKLPEYHEEIRHVSIAPEDIIISNESITTSARNRFFGEIIEIVKDSEKIGLTISVGEDFRVRITKRSFDEMGLNIGKKVYIAFKSSAVVIY